MNFKKVTVEFLVDEEFMKEMIERGTTIEVTEVSAFRDELQELLYDEGGMSGSFVVVKVEDVETPT